MFWALECIAVLVKETLAVLRCSLNLTDLIHLQGRIIYANTFELFDSAVTVNSYFLVHLAADMHCLAHLGDSLQQDFTNAAMPFVETQMLYAGYRLAHLLNALFR